jgi:hypothetical protein
MEEKIENICVVNKSGLSIRSSKRDTESHE